MFVVSMWLVGGCWSGAEQQRARRVWEMQDHEAATIAARDAILRGDLAGAQTAGEDLARQDVVPGLPDDARGHLDAVRASGGTLAGAGDLDAAAKALVDATAHCAACHAALDIDAVRPMRDTPNEKLWVGLVFEDEASWSAGMSDLEDLATPRRLDRWSDRRSAVASLLSTGSL